MFYCDAEHSGSGFFMGVQSCLLLFVFQSFFTVTLLKWLFSNFRIYEGYQYLIVSNFQYQTEKVKWSNVKIKNYSFTKLLPNLKNQRQWKCSFKKHVPATNYFVEIHAWNMLWNIKGILSCFQVPPLLEILIIITLTKTLSKVWTCTEPNHCN